jgi:hypothetical protein
LVLALGCGVSAAQTRAGGDASEESTEESTTALRRDAPAPKLDEPEWLPPAARDALAQRMQRHGEEMMLLVIGVVILSYDGAREVALDIAREPRIGRPAPGERGTISSLLSPRFFDLQDELQERSRAVADAAGDRDAARLATAYGRLVETCVSCHSVYVRPPAESPVPDPPETAAPLSSMSGLAAPSLE